MFPQASLRSRTVGFPESGSDLGIAMFAALTDAPSVSGCRSDGERDPETCGLRAVFPPLWKLKCGLTYTPHSGGLPDMLVSLYGCS